MNTLFPSPKCFQIQQPPLRGSKQARLRCPLCKHETTGGELLYSATHVWMVIDDPGGEDVFSALRVEKPSVSVAIPHSGLSSTAENNQLELNPPSASSPSSVNATTTLAKEHRIDWEKFKPITHEEFQRRKRQSSSPIGSFIQVILGGLAAIPIAMLLIWHVLGKDVGGTGPIVARYVPWVVPERFRGESDTNLDNGLLEENSSQTVRAAPSQQPSQQQDSDESPRQPYLPAESDDFNQLSINSTRSMNSAISSVATVPEPNSSANDSYRASINELSNRRNVWSELRTSSEIQTKTIVAQGVFSSICSLAEKFSSLPQDAGNTSELRSSAQTLCREILSEPDLAKIIQAGTAERWRVGSLKNEGIVFLAAIQSVLDEETYSVWIVDSPLESARKSIAVRVPKSLNPGPAAGKWYILGIADSDTGIVQASIVIPQ